MSWMVLLAASAGIALVVAFLLLLYLASPLASPKPLSLSGAHVVVTGGSSGIGKSIAVECFKQGAFITLIARNESRLLEAKKEIEKYSINDKQVVHAISVDVSKDCADMERVLKQAQEKLGPVDMLVNCAGTSVNGKFEDLESSRFEQLMAINYLGSVYSTRAVVATMKERRMGRIVFVSSQAGQVGLFGYSAYSATKFALRGLAEALQMEVKPYNIYVTVAYPPDTDTPGFAEESKTKQGKFSSSVGTDGYMLTILTSGMSPISSIAEVLEAVILMGFFRFIGLFYIASFDSIVHRCMVQKEKSEKTD
ncbi:3-ketodihydrosphingosine reductase isoform X2 [Hemicordylus capensis]|uniref:3-ketodihydrosphingosine reductase isoform X2 n=1 Tax=Hemicordylus capensis TaxID=884348 RepID=UPI002304B43A|nr:3-ketodihydrosphingosine reductase isoform X2 [Hemicordylus capensis]